jgi:hypothetical protein
MHWWVFATLVALLSALTALEVVASRTPPVLLP